MLFGFREFVSCQICKERVSINYPTCPNCKSRIINRNRNRNRNAIRNHINQINNNISHQINLNINNENYIKLPYKEKLQTKKMTFQLYNRNDLNLEAPICGICLANIEYGQTIYLLPCKHLFHKYCANKWFEKKSECPYCRKKVNFA